MNTPIDTKTNILAELWMEYRDEPYFSDFFEYADLGLPLAYLLSNKIVSITPEATKFIEDTWELFLGICGYAEDTGFEDLEEMLEGIELN